MKWRQNRGSPTVVPPSNGVDEPVIGYPTLSPQRHASISSISSTSSAASTASTTSKKAKNRWLLSKAVINLGAKKKKTPATAPDNHPESEPATAYKRKDMHTQAALLASDSSLSNGLVWRKHSNFGFTAPPTTAVSVSHPSSPSAGGRARSVSGASVASTSSCVDRDRTFSDTFQGVAGNRSLSGSRESWNSNTGLRSNSSSPELNRRRRQHDSSSLGNPFAATHLVTSSEPTRACVLAAEIAAVERSTLTVTKPIGRGCSGHGHVYLARYTSGNGSNGNGNSKPQHRVVKVLQHGCSSQARQAFEREVEMLGALRHPNVVSLTGAATQSYPMLTVFTMAAYGDLQSFLRRTRAHGLDLRPREQLVMATQIASAMSHLESQCIVHMNLNAKNILVDKRCTVKIADFSHARKLAEGSKTCAFRERPDLNARWLAPESLGRKVFSSATDVWSFGVVCWEIFSSGATPYADVHPAALHATIEKQGKRLPCPRSCPQDWYQLLMLGCWRTDPVQRPNFLSLAKNAVMIAAVHTASNATQEPIRDLGVELEGRVQSKLQSKLHNKTQLRHELDELLVDCIGTAGSTPQRTRTATGLSSASTGSSSSSSSASASSASSATFTAMASGIQAAAQAAQRLVDATDDEEDTYGTVKDFTSPGPGALSHGPAHMIDNGLCGELEDCVYLSRAAVVDEIQFQRNSRDSSRTDNTVADVPLPLHPQPHIIVPEPAYLALESSMPVCLQVNESSTATATDLLSCHTTATDASSTEGTATATDTDTNPTSDVAHDGAPLRVRSRVLTLRTNPNHDDDAQVVQDKLKQLQSFKQSILVHSMATAVSG